ncbi:MAG: TolC family protein [Sphingomonadaceae bacterium]|nr:TolC family protein [Sphingomonadaceae bacterium]
MISRLRAMLLAGAFAACAQPALAEQIALGDAIAQGVQTSPRVAQARALADAAEARARQAGVSPNPEISLQVENFAGSGMFQGFRSTEATLALSQRIELGGKRSARLGVARAERDFAFLAYKAALADLERHIRFAHAELRAAEDRALLARENVGAAEELARTARILVDAGRDPPLRQLRAESLLAEAEAEQARTFSELLTARRLLASLIGSVDPELTATASEDAAPAALPADAPTLNEQLAAAEREAARARVQLARSDAVPDITASGGVRRFRESGTTALVAGISIPLPIRNRNRNRGNIEAAGAESNAAESALLLARVEAGRAQYDARMLLSAAEVRYEALAGPSLQQAEEALRLARIGYNAGKFSLIELIDAQTALTTAKLNLIEARLDRARALAALIRANAQ